MKRWALGFGAVVLLAILAADLDLLRFPRRIHDIPLADRAVHFVLFGFLNLLTIFATAESKPSWRRGAIVSACSAALIVAAAAEEYSQRFIAGRMFSVSDLAAGTAGILAFGVLACGILRLVRGGGRRDHG